MKMFKRIVATIAIVLSLYTIAWGESKYDKAVQFAETAFFIKI